MQPSLSHIRTKENLVGVLDGKVAIVTGAGRLRGIGRATCSGARSPGADVVVTGTGRDPATFPADEKAVNWNDVHSTVEQIEAQGRRGLAFIGDISQQADVTRMMQQTLATLAGLTFWSIMPRSPGR